MLGSLIHSPSTLPLGNPVLYGWGGGGVVIADSLNAKLIFEARGSAVSWLDVVHGLDEAHDDDYMFPDIYTDSKGSTGLELRENGATLNGSWTEPAATTYSLPAIPALIAQDALEGPFWFNNGVQVPKTLAQIQTFATGKAAISICTDKGLALYKEILTGDDLTKMRERCP